MLMYCLCPGDEVSFQHVDLPKGTFVRLQPVSSAWLVGGTKGVLSRRRVDAPLVVLVCMYMYVVLNDVRALWS